MQAIICGLNPEERDRVQGGSIFNTYANISYFSLPRNKNHDDDITGNKLPLRNCTHDRTIIYRSDAIEENTSKPQIENGIPTDVNSFLIIKRWLIGWFAQYRFVELEINRKEKKDIPFTQIFYKNVCAMCQNLYWNFYLLLRTKIVQYTTMNVGRKERTSKNITE